MIIGRERASVEEGRVEEGTAEAWTARGKEGREETRGGGIERGSEGARE